MSEAGNSLGRSEVMRKYAVRPAQQLHATALALRISAAFHKRNAL